MNNLVEYAVGVINSWRNTGTFESVSIGWKQQTAIIALSDRLASLEREVEGLKVYAGEKSNQYVAAMKENAELRKALEETAEVLNLMDSEGKRAAAFSNVPEDGPIRDLCEKIGYGAVMDSAARQWFKKDSVGAITTGTCAGTLRNLKALVRTALRDGGDNDSP